MRLVIETQPTYNRDNLVQLRISIDQVPGVQPLSTITHVTIPIEDSHLAYAMSIAERELSYYLRHFRPVVENVHE